MKGMQYFWVFLQNVWRHLFSTQHCQIQCATWNIAISNGQKKDTKNNKKNSSMLSDTRFGWQVSDIGVVYTTIYLFVMNSYNA